MELKPNLLPKDHIFKAIDSHTMGEPTRIIYEGFPELIGNTMMERKEYLEKNYDHYRKALMLEPRGHRDMFGALLTTPVHKEADLGVIFMDSGGYLNMCGHGSIGCATVAVEAGFIPVKEPYTDVVLDAPAGLIRARVKIKNGKAEEVSILNVPSFLYRENINLELEEYGRITFDISFGGSFFALVDSEEIGIPICQENLEALTDFGMKLREKINQSIEVRHPYLNINSVDLVEIYGPPTNLEADSKNVVIFGDAQTDRSPCGTGTSAKIAALYTKGKLSLGQEFVYESITGSLFRGMATEETTVDGKTAIIPRVTGSAYITGFNQWMLDEEDPLRYGFLIGN
ncbi:MAG: proline racemase [Lachnospiraceae bacterium]|jgi:proline racemase|nr:proline racemase [Lachnospiraceae bacterium]